MPIACSPHFYPIHPTTTAARMPPGSVALPACEPTTPPPLHSPPPSAQALSGLLLLLLSAMLPGLWHTHMLPPMSCRCGRRAVRPARAEPALSCRRARSLLLRRL